MIFTRFGCNSKLNCNRLLRRLGQGAVFKLEHNGGPRMPYQSGSCTGSDAGSIARTNRMCHIVDDEAGICHFIASELNSLGLGVKAFQDGDSFAQALRSETPDLIFLDLAIGRTDAIAILRNLADRGFPGSIQLMSGNSADMLEDVRRIGRQRSLRMLPVLTKPFRRETLHRLLTSHQFLPTAAGAIRIELGEALDKDWVQFWYQPKVRLTDGALVGCEALARVAHPQHGILLPGSFIPGATSEEHDRLLQKAIRCALSELASLDPLPNHFEVAVNASIESLLRISVPELVNDLRHPENRVGLIIEVTEDQIIDDMTLAFEVATQLKIHGVGLSIDDFGSGYSSISRLKQLPFRELKLDHAYVRDCGSDDTNRNLCRTVIELAHSFGAMAVAEGLENFADVSAIKQLGGDLAQGFYFAEPMPIHQLGDLILMDSTLGERASRISKQFRNDGAAVPRSFDAKAIA